MQNENETSQPGKGRQPTHRLWMVEDQDQAEASWTEIAPLWPTKNGNGFTGRLDRSNVFPAGARLVITRAKARSKGADA